MANSFSLRKYNIINNFRVNVFRLVVFFLFTVVFKACDYGLPDEYTADPMYATIVDEETGLPIQGAQVIAYWELKAGLQGNHNQGVLRVDSIFTKKDGTFYFDSWGPIKVPPTADSGARFIRHGPLVMIYHEWYNIKVIYSSRKDDKKAHRVWKENGTNIHLKACSDEKVCNRAKSDFTSICGALKITECSERYLE